MVAIQALIDVLGEPVVVFDHRGSGVELNSAMRKFLGCDEDPRAVSEFWPGWTEDGFQPGIHVTEFKRLSDDLVPVRVSLSALDDGHLFLRILNAAGEHDYLHAQRLETLGRLAGGVAHDFNNVLAGIIGHVAFLKVILPDSGKHNESLDAIEEGSKKASLIIRQILNFSRLSRVSKPVRIELGELIAKTCLLLRGAIPPKFEITYDIPDTGVYLMGVEAQIAQVLVNLVMNSKDALEDSGNITVILGRVSRGDLKESVSSVFPEVDEIGVMSVRDDGCGIAPDVAKHVFEPFYSTKREKGTGLGLATVKGIVDNLGGVMEFESEVGEGTEVFFYFPLSEKGAESDEPETLPPVSPEIQGKGESILIVDDEDPVRNALYVSLVHLGYDVDRAENGELALELLLAREGGYDVVILDMLMPKLSGEEVFFRMREIDPEIAVLVMSGYSSEEAVQRILTGGGRGFIQKPFTIEALAKQVRKCVETQGG